MAWARGWLDKRNCNPPRCHRVSMPFGIGNLAYQNSFHYDLGRYITALGGVSGIATALLGVSGKTSATTDDNHQSWTTFVFNLLLSIAGPVFVAALIVGVSIALDLLLFIDPPLAELHRTLSNPSNHYPLPRGGCSCHGFGRRSHRVEEREHKPLLVARGLPKPTRPGLPRCGASGAKP